jgi:hypothetical protein
MEQRGVRAVAFQRVENTERVQNGSTSTDETVGNVHFRRLLV